MVSYPQFAPGGASELSTGVASEAWQSAGSGLCVNQVTPTTHQCTTDVGISLWVYMVSTADQFIYDINDNSSGQPIYSLQYLNSSAAFKGYHKSDAGTVNYEFLISSFPSALQDGGHIKLNTWFHLGVVHRYTPNLAVNDAAPFSATSIVNQNTPSTGANNDTIGYVGRNQGGTLIMPSGGRVSQMRIINGSTNITSFRATSNWEKRITPASESYLFEAYLLEANANCEKSEANWLGNMTLSTGAFTTGSKGPTLAAW